MKGPGAADGADSTRGEDAAYGADSTHGTHGTHGTRGTRGEDAAYGRDGAGVGAGAVLAVVHEMGPATPGPAVALELCGPHTDADTELFAARIAERHRRFRFTLERHGPGRHTLRLLPDPTAPDPTAPDPATPDPAVPGPAVPGPPAPGPAVPGPVELSAALLADLLGPCPGAGETLDPGGHQRELLREALTRPDGRGRHLEQVHWNWTGPLDRARFRAAWQSVCARESVLRAAFDWTALPRLVLHPHTPTGTGRGAGVDVVHRTRADTTWQELLEEDRGRGFDPGRPPLLRVSVLEGEPGTPARVLLTCHRALLDERGVRLLLREFYRAYLAGGVLPGGERRPDLRDHARWLARQNTDGARELWTRTAPPRHAATAVARPGPDTRQSGTGRLHRHLGEPHGSRLRSWAAARGAGESSALHAVWALLLYRAAGARGPLPVSFAVQVCAGDIALPGAAGIPGLLGGPLPMTVRVDPAAPVAALLQQARDALLDLAAYPWVHAEMIRRWTGRPPGQPLAATLVRFDALPELPPALRAELRERGIEADEPRTIAAATGPPLTVAARHQDGALLLDAVYDRAVLADADASAVLDQCLALLGALAELPDPDPTAGRVLELLAHAPTPSMAPPPPAPHRRTALSTLRAGEPTADVICLLAVPGAAPGVRELFTRAHRGPQTIVALETDGPPQEAVHAALDGVLRPGGRLVLCGWGPGAGAAYGLARALARGGRAVSLVMAGGAGPQDSARALARGLTAVPARRP
ncbi:condensation domain-containing protein [Streptomyces sp. NPDC058655]|uniref:condensation domain-containing protein n=1 Tax=Streptomyces sp. NPDC058655 TaxID=3346577 RepID=UPI003651E5B6